MRKRPNAEDSPAAEPVAALARGLAILRAFRREDAGLSNLELAARTGLARSTISRLTQSLMTLGYLDYDPQDGCYRPGAGTLALGLTALGGLSIRRLARPGLQSIADRFGCSVGLAVPDGSAMFYIEHCHGPTPLQIGMETGVHFRMATSAAGRAALAGMAEAPRAALIERIAAASDSPEALRNSLAGVISDYQIRGYVCSQGDWQPGVNAVAAPISLAGERIYAINCASSALVLHDDILPEVGAAVAALCRDLERQLSGG